MTTSCVTRCNMQVWCCCLSEKQLTRTANICHWILAHLARGDLRFALGRHVGAEHLAVRSLAPPVARLDHKLRREDVGQLGAVAIATAGHLKIRERYVRSQHLMLDALHDVCKGYSGTFVASAPLRLLHYLCSVKSGFPWLAWCASCACCHQQCMAVHVASGPTVAYLTVLIHLIAVVAVQARTFFSSSL